jgi:rod shape-determining protein MreB
MRFRIPDMAADMGTANCVIASDGILVRPTQETLTEEQERLGEGYQVRSFVARHTQDTRVIRAVGEDAYQMYGRAPKGIEVVQPIKEGKVKDPEAFVALLRHMVELACPDYNRRILFPMSTPKIAIGVPLNVVRTSPEGAMIETPEMREVKAAIEKELKATAVLISEPVAAAIGAGLEFTKAPICSIIDMGGGTTDIAALSFTDTFYHDSIEIGGDTFSDAIRLYVRRQYNVAIGYRQAEAVKRVLACAKPFAKPRVFRVTGASLNNGMPSKELKLNSEEIQECLTKSFESLTTQLKAKLTDIKSPSAYEDMEQNGIWLTGGSSQIHGLDELFSEATGVQIKRVSRPLTSVVEGVAKIISDPFLLKRFNLIK